MSLIRNGSIVDNDWVNVGDDETLPADVPVFISLTRWLAERETLMGRNTPIGVTLSSSEAPEAIIDDLDRIQVIALQFPTFKDGRGYSYARLLRERYGFEGEIRASGDVLYDQWFAMSRCGVDAFEVPEGTTIEAFNEAMTEFSLVYQATGDGRQTVMQLRHRS